MYLVVGSTGMLGSEICRQLVAAGKPVKALVRTTSDAAKVTALQRAGIQIAKGDLKDLASLQKACEGVNTIISTASSTLSRQTGDSIQSVDQDGHIDLIDVAVLAGVKKFVHISFRTTENPELQYPLKKAKLAVEKHLEQSGLDYTILQASYFMEVWLGPALAFDYDNGSAQIYGNGNGKISWISFMDVANFTMACLDHPEAKNKTIAIGGPEPLSPHEVVQIFEQTQGRTFQKSYLPEEAIWQQKEAAENDVQETFAGLMLQYAAGDNIPMEQTLDTFGLAFTSVASYAQSVSKTLAAAQAS